MSFTTGLTLYASSRFTTGVNFTFSSVVVGESNFSLLSTGIATFTGQVLSVSAPIDSISNLTSGTLNFVGGKLFSLSSTIQGADNFTVTVQGLHDYYNVNNLYTFAVDVWFPHISDVSRDLVGFSLVTNNSRATHTHTILGGGIDCSYLMDFYNRIHIEPSPLDLGQVVDIKIVSAAIWNSFFVSKVITSIFNSNLPDVVINFPLILPATLLPLENLTFNLTVERIGVPIIAGSYDFHIDNIPYPLNIIGFRALFWPFNSISDFKEVREYKTDIIKCLSAEQRFVVRPIPRVILNYTYLFKNTQEYITAKTVAKYISHYPIAQALWTEAILLKNLVVDQTIIPCVTANYEYAIGSTIVFWSSYLIWEIRLIVDITSTTIILEKGLGINYSSCWVAPLTIGYVDGSIDLTTDEGFKNTARINNISTTPYYEPLSFFTNTFQDIPILELPVVVTGGISNNFSRLQGTIESTIGLIIKIDQEIYSRDSTNIILFAANHTELNKLRRGFDYLQGRYKPFWLPSNQPDAHALSSLIVGRTYVDVTNYNFNSYPIEYVRLVGTDSTGALQYQQCFHVSSIIVNPDSTERINFSNAATVNIINIQQVQILLKVRLNTDAITYEHQARGRTLINTSVIEIRD